MGREPSGVRTNFLHYFLPIHFTVLENLVLIPNWEAGSALLRRLNTGGLSGVSRSREPQQLPHTLVNRQFKAPAIG